jgi:hypothetical protein
VAIPGAVGDDGPIPLVEPVMFVIHHVRGKRASRNFPSNSDTARHHTTSVAIGGPGPSNCLGAAS